MEREREILFIYLLSLIVWFPLSPSHYQSPINRSPCFIFLSHIHFFFSTKIFYLSQFSEFLLSVIFFSWFIQFNTILCSGVSVVYSLICSEHKMVRRAACEVFCNMPSHPAVLKVRTIATLSSQIFVLFYVVLWRIVEWDNVSISFQFYFVFLFCVLVVFSLCHLVLSYLVSSRLILSRLILSYLVSFCPLLTPNFRRTSSYSSYCYFNCCSFLFPRCSDQIKWNYGWLYARKA